mgnify:FL=1
MEIKMKEKVNVKGFTFKKRVIEESIELLGRKRNYVLNDIKFVAMIAFTNNLVENNLIIETLYDEKELENKMLEVVEPLFTQEIVKEGYKESFEEIIMDIEDYMYREYEMRSTISGFLYDLFHDLGEVDINEMANNIKAATEQVVKAIPTKQTLTEDKPFTTDREIKLKALEEVDNLKMKALMEQYINKPQEENVAE